MVTLVQNPTPRPLTRHQPRTQHVPLGRATAWCVLEGWCPSPHGVHEDCGLTGEQPVLDGVERVRVPTYSYELR